MTAFLKKWKKYFTFAALLSCFINILQLTFPFYMFTIYRNIIISYSEFSLANINWNASEFTLKHDKATKLLSTDDIDLHNLSIFVSSEATLTTWSCKIHITDDGEDYAKRAFFVTIQ